MYDTSHESPIVPGCRSCNVLLSGCCNNSLMQNAAALTFTGTKTNMETLLLYMLLGESSLAPCQKWNWLQNTPFNIQTLNSLAPGYIRDLLIPYCPFRTLTSQNAGLLVIPRVPEIMVAEPFAIAIVNWNNLSSFIREADTLSTFLSLDLKLSSGLLPIVRNGVGSSGTQCRSSNGKGCLCYCLSIAVVVGIVSSRPSSW